MFNNFFFLENRTVYEIICKKYDRARLATDENVIWRITWWITKFTGIRKYAVLLFHGNSPRCFFLYVHYLSCFVSAIQRTVRNGIASIYSISETVLISVPPFEQHFVYPGYFVLCSVTCQTCK